MVCSSQTLFLSLALLFSFPSIASLKFQCTFHLSRLGTIIKVKCKNSDYTCLTLAYEINNSLSVAWFQLGWWIVFVQVELNISLLKIVVMCLNMSLDSLVVHIVNPWWEPFSTPEVFEVQIMAWNFNFKLVSIREDSILCCSLSKLSSNIRIHLSQDLIPIFIIYY